MCKESESILKLNNDAIELQTIINKGFKNYQEETKAIREWLIKRDNAVTKRTFSIGFIEWYSGMTTQKILNAFDRYKIERK